VAKDRVRTDRGFHAAGTRAAPHDEEDGPDTDRQGPFREFNWASLFITRMVYREPALVVDRLDSMDPKPTQEQIAKYDVRLAWEKDKLRDVAASEVAPAK